MKILLCHNNYQQPGGEDKVFADEGSLLESHGHHVIRYHRHNDEILSMNKLEVLKKTIWNSETTEALTELIEAERPQVMHCHNTFPLISPSAYYTAKRHNVAVVQTLHNYRQICPKAQLLRNGKVCEDCLGKSVAWPAALHSCYRNSRPATAAVVAMLAYHHKRGTWKNCVDRFIALTEFSKEVFVKSGLPARKISVKSNFVRCDPGIGRGAGNYAVFVGRLSAEKGLQSLLDAWQLLPIDLELKILGDGPLAETVAAAAALDRRISWLGHKPTSVVESSMGEAKFLIMPSEWYEPFGLSMIEAFAMGTPVIASRMAAMSEIVKHNETGFLYEPGQAADLARVIQEAIDQPDLLRKMRKSAREEFVKKYTAATNFKQLINIYELAVQANESGV